MIFFDDKYKRFMKNINWIWPYCKGVYETSFGQLAGVQRYVIKGYTNYSVTTTFSGLFQNFLRTFWGRYEDFLRSY